MEVRKRLDNIIVRPKCMHQGQSVVLKYCRLICSNGHAIFDTRVVPPDVIRLGRTNHIHYPLVTADGCHDVSHVRRVHCDTMAFTLERADHLVVQDDPLMKRRCVLVPTVQIFVGLSAEDPAVQLVR